MAQTIRVSLPGYNALTDGTIDHYALYADSDNVLIKEERRGTIGVANNGFGTVTHSLGYIPFYIVYGHIGGGTYQLSSSYDPVNGDGWKTYIGTSKLIFNNDAGTAGTIAQYYIFYDNLQ